MKIIQKKYTKMCTLFAAAAAGVLAGCVEPPPDKNLAPSVRNFVTEGQATHKLITDRISEILVSFKVVPPLALIINEPYRVPTSDMDVYEGDLAPALGFYQENTNVPGDFSNFVSSPGAVTVVFNNGVNVIMSNFTYDINTKLTSYSLEVTSATTTPAADKVTMSIKEERLNALGFLPGVESGGLRMTGDVTFDYNGVQTTFKINRGIGAYTDPRLTVSHGRGLRYYVVNRSNNDYFRLDGVTTYIPSDVPSMWVGWIGADTFSDKNINYEVNLVLQNGAASGSLANYVIGSGGVTYSRQRYGSLSGGPYTCDLNAPTQAGSGTPITMTYIDGFSEGILPGPKFTCNEAAISDPTAL